MSYYDDPFDAAANVQPPTRSYFGQVTLEMWFCTLAKGVGKQPFDPAHDKPEARRTAIRIELMPLQETQLQFTVSRELIAESQQWTRTVLPSIVALGLSPREVNGKFVQIELVGTGRKWLNGAGEEKTETMPAFRAVYATREECLAAWQSTGAAPAEAAPAAPSNGNGHDPERVAAAAFLKPMWDASGHDRGRFLVMVAGSPILAKHFAPESPEIVALVGTPF